MTMDFYDARFDQEDVAVVPSDPARPAVDRVAVADAVRTLLPGLRVANYVERWATGSPAVQALSALRSLWVRVLSRLARLSTQTCSPHMSDGPQVRSDDRPRRPRQVRVRPPSRWRVPAHPGLSGAPTHPGWCTRCSRHRVEMAGQECPACREGER